jgi:flagellar biosynthesis GTPase FlhF
MSMAASAENTMFKKIENEEIKNNEIKNNENNEKGTNEEIHDSDDDMIVISIRETNQPQEEKVQEAEEQKGEAEEQEAEAEEQKGEAEEQKGEAEEQKGEAEEQKGEAEEQEAEKAKSKQQEEEEEQKGEELFFKVRDDMDKKNLFPIMPCNMVSAFVCAMEHVEYLDIKDVERKALVIELVKCLAYINNEYGAKECFDYLFQNNMTDDIIKTIIDCTKDRYDINKYPHTNRNIVLSCVSLSKKVKKTTKPKLDMLDELFDFKFSFCDLKRFFRIKDSSKSV